MGLHKDYDDASFIDYQYEEESQDSLSKRRQVQQLIEDRLEKQRLKDDYSDIFDELDEIDDEFDWDDKVL